jgi:hypothetical protein
MTDKERNSFYNEKFGDIATYHLLPEDPLYFGTRRLAHLVIGNLLLQTGMNSWIMWQRLGAM